MRLASPDVAPSVSVIALLFVGRDYLLRCLDALLRQDTEEPVEVIVCHDDRIGDIAAIRERFPRLRFVGLAGRRSPAELRARGIADARAPVVALVEDHCPPRRDWCSRILEAHRARPNVAIGGTVEKGFPPGKLRDSGLNWALYLTDYSRYMRPMAEGPSPSLTDCNVSYKIAGLERYRAEWEDAFHENVVHGLLERAGETLWLDPEIVVYEQRGLPLGDVLRDRYSFGRLFGSSRVAGATMGARLKLAAFALAMPPVLVLRAGRNLFARGRHRGAFFRAFPALLLTSGTWMLGEFVGYVSGRAPASLAVPDADDTAVDATLAAGSRSG
ncbi:MAG: glycosyltransferase [Gemmatimonadota bacterium]|jgi:hypothetical protein